MSARKLEISLRNLRRNYPEMVKVFEGIDTRS